MTEPCPFCRTRIQPITWGNIKKCPICGKTWMETGSGLRNKHTPPNTGGETAEAATTW